MAALSGKPLANLTKETLTKMRIDQSFDVFYPITLPARAKAWLAIQAFKKTTHFDQAGGWCPNLSLTTKGFKRVFKRVYNQGLL